MITKYALVSVFDKSGIVDFAEVLVRLDYKIISTGGTAKVLKESGINVVPIQEITGNPESFDGRMKTISFQIESGILFRRNNPIHQKQAKQLGIKPIDIVVCNLYPFEETTKDPKVALSKAIESIDVGGPTMIRAAAKNFHDVLVVVDPNDYDNASKLLKEKTLTHDLRQKFAGKAFYHLSYYDSQIGKFLGEETFPEEIPIPGKKILDLRYGENPHQKASLYIQPNSNSIFTNLKKLWGRDLSWLNLTDINAGMESVKLFNPSKDGKAAVIIKHNSPCGIALGSNIKQALQRAIDGDPESAFGGIIVLNWQMDMESAKIIGNFKNEKKANIDIIACPEIEKNALEYLKVVRKSMGIYTFGNIKYQISNIKCQTNIRWVDGGFITQTQDNNIDDSFNKWTVVTKTKPTKKQIEQMKIAWKFISRIKSNSVIVVDKNLPMTRGIGCGQTSRLRSTRIALSQAGNFTKGGILASDSFFPFDDSVKLAEKHGISAIVQQGGSINDKLSIDAADKAGISMVFTGRRAFWH